MSKYKIEKGVPIPDRTRAELKLPFPRMEVGDSFFRPGGPKGISSRIDYWSKKTGFKFTQRSEKDGVRVWRIA